MQVCARGHLHKYFFNHECTNEFVFFKKAYRLFLRINAKEICAIFKINIFEPFSILQVHLNHMPITPITPAGVFVIHNKIRVFAAIQFFPALPA